MKSADVAFAMLADDGRSAAITISMTTAAHFRSMASFWRRAREFSLLLVAAFSHMRLPQSQRLKPLLVISFSLFSR